MCKFVKKILPKLNKTAYTRCSCVWLCTSASFVHLNNLATRGPNSLDSSSPLSNWDFFNSRFVEADSFRSRCFGSRLYFHIHIFCAHFFPKRRRVLTNVTRLHEYSQEGIFESIPCVWCYLLEAPFRRNEIKLFQNSGTSWNKRGGRDMFVVVCGICLNVGEVGWTPHKN